MEIIQEPGHLSIRSFVLGTTGQPSKQMQRLTLRFVINVSDSIMSLVAVRISHPYDGPVAICSMGPRYLGSLSNWNQANEVFGGGD